MNKRAIVSLVLGASAVLLGGSLSLLSSDKPQKVEANSAEIIYPGGTTSTIAPVQDSNISIQGEDLTIDLGDMRTIDEGGKATITASYDLVDDGTAARSSTFAFPLLANYEDLHKEEALPTVSFGDFGGIANKKTIRKILYIQEMRNSDEYFVSALQSETFNQMIDDYNNGLENIPGFHDTLYHYRYSTTFATASSLRFADLYFVTEKTDGVIYQGETGMVYANPVDHSESYARYIFEGDEKTASVDFFTNRKVTIAEWLTTDEDGKVGELKTDQIDYEAECTWPEYLSAVATARSLDADFVIYKLSQLGFSSDKNVINLTYYDCSNIDPFDQYLAFLIYEIELGGGGKEYAMEVSYRLTPSRHDEYNPVCHRINYVLTPAKLWKSFSGFQITVRASDGYLIHSSHEFEATESGWKSADDNPSIDSNLEFDYCESADPAYVTGPDWEYPVRFGLIIVALFILFPILMAAAAPLAFGSAYFNIVGGVLIAAAFVSGIAALIVVLTTKKDPLPPK